MGKFIIPTDELIFFKMVKTINQFILGEYWETYWNILCENHMG